MRHSFRNFSFNFAIELTPAMLAKHASSRILPLVGFLDPGYLPSTSFNFFTTIREPRRYKNLSLE